LRKYTQTITILDDTPPVLEGVPADLVLSCADELPNAALVTATDNCDDSVLVGFTEETNTGNCPSDVLVTRTWTATDSCGNAATASQIITVSDDIAPVITGCPADLTVDCVDDVPAPNTALVTATDICGVANITHLSDVQDGDECSGTIIRTYRATDECGNFTDCVQTIEYNDTEAPVFVNPPANITVDCASIPDADEVTAIDNCSDVDVTIAVEDIDFSGGCAGVIQRTWTATDACGNVATHEQYITLVDSIAPVLSGLPENVAYDCGEEIPAPAVVTATDNCDESVDVAFSQTIVDGDCPQAYTIIRTWTAVDVCENEVSYTQTITINDTTAPVFDIEDSVINADCDENVVIETPSAFDDCSDVVVELSEIVTDGNCPGEWTEGYTWTATDECGNGSSVSLTVIYEDDVAPVFTGTPDDLVFACVGDVPAADVTLLSAIDNCGEVTIVH